ncbi:MAG: NAD(P)/FAD-dependent oxidoreductase [Bacteroidota bacterium]|nr:NAD(P)/FAD-dependent oxidoreductase [Bacteroidota bacterium]
MLPEYDVAIIGGGLAGLAASIQLSKKGYSVILFEKEAYPFHKVCGEYISLESWDFLASLGIPLKELNLPVIDTLHLTSPNGKKFITTLPLGGFGISRYLLDATLAQIAIDSGVHLFQKTKADAVSFNDDFTIQFSGQTVKAKVCCAAYGKRSNLDVKWNRSFLQYQSHHLNNYVGIKYHVKTQWKENVIGLHNFKNGYCGISKIESDNYCLCYMTKAENLKASGNSVERMQEEILYQNPHLKKIFTGSEFSSSFPVTISQISFSPKTKVENNVLMLGDAAGMITPLCGNGMSIALHTSKIATLIINDFLQQKITRIQMEEQYEHQWQKHFSNRLQIGRTIQSFFGSNLLSNLFVGTFKALPFLASPVIKQTHGKPF